MYWDLGYTQVYYAHEYEDCDCFYEPELVWHAGEDLHTNEQCEDENCDGGGPLIRSFSLALEPRLKYLREPTYDIYSDPDLKIVSGFTFTPIDDTIGIFQHPDTGERRYAKIFIMKVKYVSPKMEIDTEVAFGVEIKPVPDEDVQFRKIAKGHPRRKYMYNVEIGPERRNCTILATF